jgi:hypothetical protein
LRFNRLDHHPGAAANVIECSQLFFFQCPGHASPAPRQERLSLGLQSIDQAAIIQSSIQSSAALFAVGQERKTTARLPDRFVRVIESLYFC